MPTTPPSRAKVFDPGAGEPHRLSRTKLQLFLDCPRCFALDRRHGIARPDGMTPSLNIAVDALLKREFDEHRAKGTKHPVMLRHGVDAVPCLHPLLGRWRENFQGVEYAHKSGFVVTGALDDLWQTPDGRYAVAEYKALSTEAPPSSEWLPEYHRRQMEIYQWLLRKNGLDVQAEGYFVFANADRAAPTLDDTLHFALTVIPYTGSDTWIDDALAEAKECLTQDALPTPSVQCAWCAYRRDAGMVA